MVLNPNNTLGFYSAISVGLTTLIFAISILLANVWVSYFICMILSWSYVLLSCSFYSKTNIDRTSVSLGGVAFAIMYATIISVVYFTQISTVANNTASESALRVLSYANIGSLFFNLELFGYGMMSLSTFLIGIAMIPKNRTDTWLKALLVIHGIFLVCIALPILNVFKDSSAGSTMTGSLISLFWCAYFIPVAILAVKHFHKELQESQVPEPVRITA
jgi:hypothetical protein